MKKEILLFIFISLGVSGYSNDFSLLENIFIERSLEELEILSKSQDRAIEVSSFIRSYQITQDKKYLKKAEKAMGKDLNSNLDRCLYGVIQGFWAYENTIFGMKNIENMEDSFSSITGENHWIIHYLRGTTLYYVTSGLPDIFILDKHKKFGKEYYTIDFDILNKAEIPNIYREYLEEIDG